MKSLPIIASCAALALVACSEPTVHSACYKNGPHDSMSDGRIITMCDCVTKDVEALKLGEKQTKWVITLLRGKQVEDTLTNAEQQQLRGITMRVSDIQGECLVAAKVKTK